MLQGRVRIDKTLGEEPRRLVPEGVSLKGTVLDPDMKPHGGRIKLPVPVIHYIGREKLFMRSEPGTYDHTISKKHGYKTRTIMVPWMDNYQIVSGRPVLNMILFRADNVVRVAQRVQAGDASPADLQKSVNRYHDEIQRALTGKRGLLTRDLFGFRCKHSLRIVATPGPEYEYWEMGLPKIPAAQAGIKDGDWILALRSPVLWQGSVLVMKARLVDGTGGQVNPFCWQGLGLDFDGDQMGVIRVPIEKNPWFSQDLRRAVEDPTLDHFKWYDEFLVMNREEEPFWGDIKFDLATRTQVTGLSLSPEECLNPENSEFLQTVAMGAKSVPEDLVDYANGMDIGTWAKATQAAAIQITQLKLEIGLLGATTDKAAQLVMAFGTREQLRSLLSLKERLTDLMMKNAKKGGGTGYSTNSIMCLFERRDEFDNASPEKAVQYLVELGFDQDEFLPVIELIYDLGGVTDGLKEHLPLLAACRLEGRESLVRVLEGEIGRDSIAARIQRYEEGAYEEVGGVIPYKRISVTGRKDVDPGRSLPAQL